MLSFNAPAPLANPLHSPPLDSYRVDLETNSEDANTQLVLSFNAPAHCDVSWDLDWVSLTPGVNWSNDGVYTPYDLTLLQVGAQEHRRWRLV